MYKDNYNGCSKISDYLYNEGGNEFHKEIARMSKRILSLKLSLTN